MNLTYRIAEKVDFPGAYRALFAHLQHEDNLRRIVENEWNVLMSNQDVLCMVVEDTEKPVETRIVGCAQTVFVSDAFVHYARTAPRPYAIQQACSRLPDGSCSPTQVSAVNSGKGLNTFTARFGWDSSLPPDIQQQIRLYMDEKYALFYRGYQFKELLITYDTIDANFMRYFAFVQESQHG